MSTESLTKDDQQASSHREGAPLVETLSLGKTYDGFAALKDCTLHVDHGEVFGLLGPNGAGKTTLIRLLMGFLHPTQGSASILGLDCYSQSLAVHEQVAYLPGEARLFRQMRGREVLRFFADARPNGNLARSLELANRLELDLSRSVANCSTGMRHKLALSVVMAVDCPLMILDEPTANLDPTVRGTVLDLVRDAAAGGQTIILSSHVLSEIELVCDRVSILRSGELVQTQLMSDLRRQHRIRGQLTGPMTPPPRDIAEGLEIETLDDGHVIILTPGELSPLLGWLATLPLEEVCIEPVGLQAVYDRFHPRAFE